MREILKTLYRASFFILLWCRILQATPKQVLVLPTELFEFRSEISCYLTPVPSALSAPFWIWVVNLKSKFILTTGPIQYVGGTLPIKVFYGEGFRYGEQMAFAPQDDVPLKVMWKDTHSLKVEYRSMIFHGRCVNGRLNFDRDFRPIAPRRRSRLF